MQRIEKPTDNMNIRLVVLVKFSMNKIFFRYTENIKYSCDRILIIGLKISVIGELKTQTKQLNSMLNKFAKALFGSDILIFKVKC